jgi:hypothetical protein
MRDITNSIERNGFRMLDAESVEWLILDLAWEKEIEARNA